MRIERSSPVFRFDKVIKRAQECLGTADLVGSAEEGSSPLIFEIMEQGGGMKPYVSSDVLPSEKDQEYEKIMSTLKANSHLLVQGDSEYGRKSTRCIEQLGEIRSDREAQHDFLKGLINEYQEISIPSNFAATGIISTAWEEHGFNEKWYSKDTNLAKALFIEVEKEDRARGFISSMGQHIGLEEAEGRNTNDGIIYYDINGSIKKIIEPGILNSRKKSEIRRDYLERLGFLNWVEWSVVHGLEYNERKDDVIISHYPLIVNDYWYLGFAYTIIDKEGIENDVSTERYFQDKTRRTTFKYVARNLRDILIESEISEIDEDRFYVKDWQSEKERILNDIKQNVIPCLAGKTTFPAWFEIESSYKDKYNEDLARVYDQIERKRDKVRRERRQFHENNFSMIHHELSKFDESALNVLSNVPDIDDLEIPKMQLEYAISKTSARQFKMKVLAGSIIEESFTDIDKSKNKWEESISHLSVYFEDIIDEYTFSVPDELKLSDSVIRIIWQILEHSERHDTKYNVEIDEAEFYYDNKFINIDFTKTIPLSDSKGIIEIMQRICALGGDKLTQKSLTEGTEMIAQNIFKLGGTSYWSFRPHKIEDNDQTVNLSASGIELRYWEDLLSVDLDDETPVVWIFQSSIPLTSNNS